MRLGKKITVGMLSLTAVMTLTAGSCESDAEKASGNLSTAADNFEIQRRIVFYDGINAEYLLVVEGRCSVTVDDRGKLDVTCKVGEGKRKEGEFVKHFLGLSDNVTWFAEQTQVATVSTYHTRVIFKPESILPAPEIR